jgi:hypothetical protein
MASTPGRRSPPEETKQDIRSELTERTLELTIAWVYALREKIEALEAQVSEQSSAPLEARIARLESEIKNLRGYLKACGIKPPDALSAPEFLETAPVVVLEGASGDVRAREAFSPPPPELFRHVQVVTGAQWGPAASSPTGPARLLRAVADGFPPETPGVIRVFRRDLDFPLATLPTLVEEGRVEALWEHGDLSLMAAPEEGDIELYFEVEVSERKTASPIVLRARLLEDQVA